MGLARKLKVDDEYFEEGKDHVVSIRITEKDGIVKIGFDHEYEWDYKIITLTGVKSLLYTLKPGDMGN